MKVLAPIDGSDPALAALSFAADLATRFNGSLDVVHITDYEDDSTEEIADRAREILEATDFDTETEIITHMNLDETGVASNIGDHILELASTRGYDHIVVGRHGEGGRIEDFILGSTSEKLATESEVPVTVVP